MLPAVPLGAAGENFLKFDTFRPVFKAIFYYFLRPQGGYPPTVGPALGIDQKRIFLFKSGQVVFKSHHNI